MNREGITDFGLSLLAPTEDEKLSYDRGINNFVVTHETLQELLKENEELKQNMLIGVSNSSSDGASGLQGHYCNFENEALSSLDGVRRAIYNLSDFIFSGNKSDRDYFLGKKESKEIVKMKCGSLKACIHGSDAHSEDKIFNPTDSKYCWIKADSTFEGLKQVIYEPEDRVKIQEEKPEKKNSYEIIDKIIFKDDLFLKEKILVSKNLTVIIGGKSTGKSLLLRNIAETIDKDQVDKKLREVNIKPYSNDVENFQVTWLDSQEKNKIDSSGPEKKIIYIPQSYLNRLVDDDEKNTSIDEIIKKVLSQEDIIKNYFKDLENAERENKLEVNSHINNIFNIQEDIDFIKEDIKNIGDETGIQLEIDKLTIELDELKKKSGMSEEEQKQSKKLLGEIKNQDIKKEEKKNDLNVLMDINFDINLRAQKIDLLSPEAKEEINEYLQKVIKDTEAKIKEKIEGKICQTKIELAEEDTKYKQYLSDYKPYVEKSKNHELIEEKNNKLRDEEKKIETIRTNKRKLKIIESEYTKLIYAALRSLNNFYDTLGIEKEKIIQNTNIKSGLEFNIEIAFQKTLFQEMIHSIVDLRQISKFTEIDLLNYKISENFNEDLEKILLGILNEKLILKGKYTKKEAINKILKNWHIFKYKIKQNGDEISDMSPGKKSFLLLRLLIELDNSKCPILIDQPEDDLDNRSIYNELVEFIKDKKKERQIIIVTHNPNIVVGADAECVIVANQYGEESKNRDLLKFDYISGALETEFKNKNSKYILNSKDIKDHICDILEGGEPAFENRKNKYNFK